MVRFENVGLRYGLGPEVLQDISFFLPPGSFHFLVGASGAGKSSLLRLMYMALKPSRGLITLFGRDIATTTRKDLPALRRRVGVVFQEFRLMRHLSAFDNVALPLRVAGTSNLEIQRSSYSKPQTIGAVSGARAYAGIIFYSISLIHIIRPGTHLLPPRAGAWRAYIYTCAKQAVACSHC